MSLPARFTPRSFLGLRSFSEGGSGVGIRQFIACICVFSFLLLLSPASASAASKYLNTNPDVPNSLHNNAQVVFIEVASALLCQLIGIDVINPESVCLGIDRMTNRIGFQNPVDAEGHTRIGGAIGSLVSMISMSYDIPVHTADYVSYAASNFGFIKPVYAQGTGFANLSALISLWTRFRDLTYLAFVLIFVVIGFGIMLRVKLDPKTVMSVQNQIPKIIITIVLITFSYAIAGLLIDMMWVVTYTGINLITADTTCVDGTSLAERGTINLLNTPFHYVNQTLGCPFQGNVAIDDLAYNVGQTIGDIFFQTFLSLLGINNAPIQGCNLWQPSKWGACIKKHIFDLFSWLIGIGAMLVIGIAIFVQLFRIWFNLLKSYIYVLLYTILSPFYIFLGLLPGNTSFGFSQWVRHMLFALAIYPVTIFLFLTASVIANDPRINNPGNNVGDSFVPPLIGNPNIANNMGYLIGLGVILLAPEVITMVRDALKTPPSKYGAAITGAVGVGTGVMSQPLSKGWGSLTARDQSGAARGPLAFAADTFVGNRTKGLANKQGAIGNWWRKKYGDTVTPAKPKPTLTGDQNPIKPAAEDPQAPTTGETEAQGTQDTAENADDNGDQSGQNPA